MATETTTVAMKQEKEGGLPPSYYTVVRKSTYLDRMFYLYHKLGIQSNVLVGARYGSTEHGGQRLDLSDEAVFSALHTVVTKYPELGIVGVVEPGEKETHHLSLASLHAIDLESCVEFIDDDVPGLGAELFQKLHNEWLWADGEVNPGQPWWKIIVLGRREVVFLFHHLVCDGSFGMTFHREFLTALNDAAALEPKPHVSRIVQIDLEKVRLNKKFAATIHRKPPMFGAIVNAFRFLFYRIFYATKLFFVDFAKPRELPKDPLAIVPPSDRMTTKVTSCRIPAEKTNAIIAACRAHGTTFTPFLITMITGTLAADFYPKAKVGFSRYAVDMRAPGRFGNLPAEQGKMLNLAGSAAEPEWLKKYHRAFPIKSGETVGVDAKATWALIQDYGRRMKGVQIGGENSPLCKAWLSGNNLGPTLEEMMTKYFPSMGLVMRNSFSFSNVGVMKPDIVSPTRDEPAFGIEDIQFSTGPMQGAVGYHGIVFNTAGVAGGDTAINACTEEGMAPEGMPQAVLDGVMARIDALLCQSDAFNIQTV